MNTPDQCFPMCLRRTAPSFPRSRAVTSTTHRHGRSDAARARCARTRATAGTASGG